MLNWLCNKRFKRQSGDKNNDTEKYQRTINQSFAKS